MKPRKCKGNVDCGHGSCQKLRSKRKQVKIACVNCRKSKTGCSDCRPCKRCISLGIEDTCVDAPRKRRRRKSKSNGKKKQEGGMGVNNNKVQKKRRGRKRKVNIEENINLMKELEGIVKENENNIENKASHVNVVKLKTEKEEMNKLKTEKEETEMIMEEQYQDEADIKENYEKAMEFINQLKNDTSYNCTCQYPHDEDVEDCFCDLDCFCYTNYNPNNNNNNNNNVVINGFSPNFGEEFFLNNNFSHQEDQFYSSSSESNSVCSSPGEDFLSSNIPDNIAFLFQENNFQDTFGFYLSETPKEANIQNYPTDPLSNRVILN